MNFDIFSRTTVKKNIDSLTDKNYITGYFSACIGYHSAHNGYFLFVISLILYKQKVFSKSTSWLTKMNQIDD